MLGGSLNGGKIKGTFPKLSSDSDHWLTRGRIIPTMPWESVWNGVAQWFHVHEDEDLDFAMPNRKNFETCSLFTDTDLFVDGVCQCTNGATVCDEITYPPTTVTPSYSPTTDSPTAELPTDGTLVKTIFPPGSTVEDFGCNDGSRPERAVDGTTVQYDCGHSGNNTGMPYVFTVTPDHGLHTIAKGLRFYSGASCIYCQPVTYVFQGRASAEDPWTEIASGELPWISAPLSNNPAWLPINSTYEDGDSDHSFTAVDFPSQDTAYLEYRFSFPLLRGGADGTLMRFGEMEVPGKSNLIFSVLVNQPFLFGVK
jgi:hypothetical protein